MLLKQKIHFTPISNHGFALPFVLFTLVAVSLIAAISVKVSVVDENLGRNQTDRNISRQMAELALIDAKDDIMCAKKIDGSDRNDTSRVFNYKSSFSVANDTCVQGLCGVLSSDTSAPLWSTLQTADVTTLGFAEYGQYSGRSAFTNDINGTAKAPRYIIESVQTNVYTGTQGNDERQYRITAVGFGRFSDKTFTKLQILYRSYNQECGYNSKYTRNSNLETPFDNS
jgi:Tfp pilus assembly protein PilX